MGVLFAIMESADDWRIVEGGRGRKMYHNMTTGQSTFEKPNVLKSISELQRVAATLNML